MKYKELKNDVQEIYDTHRANDFFNNSDFSKVMEFTLDLLKESKKCYLEFSDMFEIVNFIKKEKL